MILCVIMRRMSKALTVVFAGGGTGGHIYPGIAVCEELKVLAKKNNTELKIIWFGNKSGSDKNIVEKSGIKSKSVDAFSGIPSGKLRRYFSVRNFLDIFNVAAGFFVSFFLLIRLKPALLFSKGGFVSVPPCVAAAALKIKVFTHECDFTPGLATKINSRFASGIFVSYDETKRYFSGKLKEKIGKITVTGNPVRLEFYNADAEKGLEFVFGSKDFKKKKPVLLVLGGSSGARQINLLVKENLEWLCERFFVVHQTGLKQEQAEESALQAEKHKGDYFPFAFIYEQMCDVTACADIVLSRAGANSIWECSCLGKPLILIPLSGSGTRGDQCDNAKFFEERGAALVLEGENAVSKNLKACLEKMTDEDFRKKTAESCAELSKGEKSASKIAGLLFDEIINEKTKRSK